MAETLGLYVHLPFCRARCAYCDFAVIAGRADLVPEYLDLLVREIERAGESLGHPPADTLHFGGGSPSLLDPPELERLRMALERAFDLAPLAEVGLEANPEDVTRQRLDAWVSAGITRLPVGVQSTSPEGLAALGRPGEAAAAVRALRLALEAGIPSVGADLIFGWPGQEVRRWEDELACVVGLGAHHVSCYALELDGRTPLVRAIERGERPRPDPDAAAEMYGAAARILREAGYERYEISNWARPGHASRHNRKYWSDRPYLGLGLGAASYVGGRRWTNPRRFREYERMVRSGRSPAAEPYDPDRRAGEAIVLGLRREEGIDLADVAAVHGEGPVEARRPVLQRGVADGLLVRENGRLKLSERGRLIADELLADLL
ncbi:MAG: radical SAM family heme chaperone HemW [Acidobacteria bacterium]|nr:MAG: radical SAM family heme chaperone HemW [Acidobacteriota bacterium]